MHVVSDQLMDAYEADNAAGFPARFHAWWKQAISSDADKAVTERLVFAHRDEFEVAGVQEDEEQFLFLYARALMPELGDLDYLETMDAIFAPVEEPDRLKLLNDIARKYGHRG
ncbi:MAG: hypothetical protein ABJP70_06120 [Erythrobacter sp.]